MQEGNQKQLTTFLIGLAATAAVIGVGTFIGLKFVPQAPAPPPTQLPPLPKAPDGSIRLEPPGGGAPQTPPASPQFQIIEPTIGDPNSIRYSANGFAPAERTITATDRFGCLVTVLNTTAEPIRVGVSPHAEAGDPGADYGLIPPQESKLLDVRYPGLTEIELHDHAKPNNTVHITYGEGCR